MFKTPTTMLAIASFLAVSASTMAQAEAATRHHVNRRAVEVPYGARAEAPGVGHVRSPGGRYDPSTYEFEPNPGPGELLFDRAKGNIE